MPRATPTRAPCSSATSPTSPRTSDVPRPSSSTRATARRSGRGKLYPEIELTGRFERIEKPVDVDGVIQVVDHALNEEALRQMYRQAMRPK
jgi:hypothetical protein